MDAPSTDAVANNFAAQVAAQLNPEMLTGPVRLDNTHTVVIIPLATGPIHAHLRKGIGEAGVQDVLDQIAVVPSLKGLVRS